MASKNCPETPRQKMIGMMYLVLTAMLALNVSSEILHGFTLVDTGLKNTISSNEKQNEGMYDDFQAQNDKNPARVGPFLEDAKQVKLKSDELFKYIHGYKYGILRLADGDEADKNAVEIKSKDNLDAAGEYSFIKGNDKILRKKIEEYRDFIVKMTDGDPAKQEMFKKLFDTSNKFGKTWSSNLFESMPVAAVITMLTKYQSDIRTSEAETVQYLRAKADLQDFTISKLTAFIIPESSYVLQGGTFKAKIVLSAEDTTNNKAYRYYVNGSGLSSNEIMLGASGVGPHTVNASVEVPLNTGGFKRYDTKAQYMVGKPSATLSNVDLNVVFKGIENKFRISVPGVAESELRVSAEGANISRSGDFYIVRPVAEKQIKINVAANINGKVSNMGSETYRVKYLPNPSAYIQYTDGSGITRLTKDAKMSKKQLRSGIQLIASYGEDALIEAKFNITSFNMVTLMGATLANGSTLNAKQRADIEELEGGDYITFKNIKAVGPDGKTRDIGAVTVNL